MPRWKTTGRSNSIHRPRWQAITTTRTATRPLDSRIRLDFPGSSLTVEPSPGAGMGWTARALARFLEMDAWHASAERLRAAGTRFVIEPPIRFEGQPGEQATMFLLDPCGNALEFKVFADRAQLFAK
ncbi:putative dioxygenase of extradiol dioxygenase family [Rhodanobacter denitrificans]|uniref:Putative dioxygenase of extradiol dioxygenase family n=1 Tax=Rhodanobacter denitrificans TaxID=666685 RepID=M4NHC1_9GAMM|nr:putative dioxygenase of extradiol dioxygenase family [Rhodanobacter denitrificans]